MRSISQSVVGSNSEEASKNLVSLKSGLPTRQLSGSGTVEFSVSAACTLSTLSGLGVDPVSFNASAPQPRMVCRHEKGHWDIAWCRRSWFPMDSVKFGSRKDKL
jgi:hypothetical protein